MLSRQATAILLLLLAGLLLLMLALGTCVQEDAFISFRYARNLVQGHGLVYNVGERVEGYTNFLWTVLIAGGMALGADPVPLARFLGMACTLLVVLWAYRSARRWERVREETGGLLAALMVAANPGVFTEGVQGLETLCYTLLVSAGVLLAAEARAREARGDRAHPRLVLLGAGLLGLAALTRPDAVGIFGLVTVGVVLWRVRSAQPIFTRWDLAAVGVFLMIYLPYWLWRFDYYGYPFPNSFYAKTGGGIWHVLRGLEYLGGFLLVNPVLTIVSIVAIAGPAWRRRRGLAVLPASALSSIGMTVLAGYLLYVVVIGGDFKKTSRFILPVLPLWAVMLEAALSRWAWTRAGHAAGRGRGRLSRWAPAIVLLALLANGAAQIPYTLGWVKTRTYDLRRRKACGLYLKSVAAPHEVLAIHSAGIIPYYCELPTIDMWGITNLHIGHKKMPDMGRSGRLPGHEKEDYPWVFAQNPDYYVDKWFVITRRPVPDLLERVFSTPGSQPIAERYEPRGVALQLDLGEGLREYWFNYLELRKEHRR